MSDKSNEKYSTYQLGDWELQSGEVLPGAWIAYKTFGDPKAPGGVILYPSWYSGNNIWLLDPDGSNLPSTKALNPEKYFIIITALFGNGESISPSNSPHISPFPTCTFYDNVRAQHALLTQHFGVNHLRAVLGWSMGAGQTYQWATQYPDFMDLIIPFCGSAKTSEHNQVFLEGVKAALLGAKKVSSAGVCMGGVKEKEAGRTWTKEEKEVGLKALARVYAGW
ncbi:putative homoserine acetyltransferase family protein [Phaeomoniella chlamydospora]|uniref:Putative homoserine acetyltransferase family protein n=1 Tax=Phaeomoniella chlamydospora TaxID=158046 RepID=A0A0G2EEN7_PHACM|nr:putative homoserine acetyltransferase family protein [Phaeomoniella chlamydospora]